MSRVDNKLTEAACLPPQPADDIPAIEQPYVLEL